MTSINNLDIIQNKYSIELLQLNIDHLNLFTILRTQILTIDFVNKYIMNKKYQKTEYEKCIDRYVVGRYQQHLKIPLGI